MDIIARAGTVCDELIIGVAVNPLKKPVFSTEER
jgi:phosphopantetheine adenylyltransferase